VACALLGLPLDHFWNFDFGLGAISVVEIRAGRAVLRALNLGSHLGAEAEPPTDETAKRSESGAL
jgi:broad specificity phosphatase PhoE